MIAPGWTTIERALGRHVYAAAETRHARAAVALVLRDGRDGIELLFIRRAEPEDQDLQATAVRETREETSIDLAGGGRLLGRLDDLRAVASGRPVDLVISPFVFRLLSREQGAASHEVMSVHWLALSTLLDPAASGIFEFQAADTTVRLPCLRADGLLIWGLSYRMFANLSELLRTV